LGWHEVECRRYPTLSDTERREIELEENLRRKDLTELERSRGLWSFVEAARQVDEEQLRTESVRNSGPGRPEEAGSPRRVSLRIGVPITTIKEANGVATSGGWQRAHDLPLPRCGRSLARSPIDAGGELHRFEQVLILAIPAIVVVKRHS